MAERGQLAGGITRGSVRAVGPAWRQPGGYEHQLPAAPFASPAPDGSAPVSSEQASLRHTASAHGQVAIQASELTQGSTARCEGRWQQLVALRVRGSPPDAAADTALKGGIQPLGRIIISWQARTADSCLSETRRTRNQAARVTGRKTPPPRQRRVRQSALRRHRTHAAAA